jgi:hypothetical protein
MTKMTSMLLGLGLAISTVALPATVATAADDTHANANMPITLDHQGRHYVYTVTQIGATRVISGVEERYGERLELRVNGRYVRGHFDGVPVAFRTPRRTELVSPTEVAVR